ncbi:fimbrial protein [Escherichia coli]|uniref:Fimbrial protein n=1 Tax=Escherichia coli TaxID=562 RepID=A0A376KM93_ECOLX|nr:fimbrial protein [Escherichia coli]
MPDGFTPVDFDITYDCGDTSKIKNSLQMRIDGTTGGSRPVQPGRQTKKFRQCGPMSVFVLKNLGGGVANIPFQNGILPVDPSGHGTINMRAWPVNLVGGELEQENFRAPPPLPSSCGKRRRCVLINATLRHSYPCCSSAYLYSAFFFTP